jgi:hypothetical protein
MVVCLEPYPYLVPLIILHAIGIGKSHKNNTLNMSRYNTYLAALGTKIIL